MNSAAKCPACVCPEAARDKYTKKSKGNEHIAMRAVCDIGRAHPWAPWRFSLASHFRSRLRPPPMTTGVSRTGTLPARLLTPSPHQSRMACGIRVAETFEKRALAVLYSKGTTGGSSGGGGRDTR